MATARLEAYQVTKEQDQTRHVNSSIADNISCKLFLFFIFQNEVLAKQYIIGLFATHVDAINTIYSNTVFKTYDNTINYSGVRFKIQRIKVSVII